MNLAIDRTYEVPGFRVGRLRKVPLERAVPGGKGVNVARVLARHGIEVAVAGTLGPTSGAWLEARFVSEGIPLVGIPVGLENRLCLTFVDPARRSETTVNEEGPRLTRTEAARVRHTLEGCFVRHRHLILAGSLAPGLPTSFYRDLIGAARRAGLATSLDASGAALRLGACALPDLVKGTLTEWREAFGLRSRRGLPALMQGLFAGSRTLSLVTDGPAPVPVWRGGDLLGAVTPPAIRSLSPIGSGDAFLGGFLASRFRGGTLRASLRYAAAAGAANAIRLGAGFVGPREIRPLLARTRVEGIE